MYIPRFIRKQKWWQKFTKKLYENAHQYREIAKWQLQFNGYYITIYDMSYWGDTDKIRIIQGDDYEGRVFPYRQDNIRALTISYLLNEYQHLPKIMRTRMKEIFEYLNIPDDHMDKLEENVIEFFGVENL